MVPLVANCVEWDEDCYLLGPLPPTCEALFTRMNSHEAETVEEQHDREAIEQREDLATRHLLRLTSILIRILDR